MIAVAVLAALATGCFGTRASTGTAGLLSRQQALAIAAKRSWHPDQVTATLTSYRPHPGRPRKYTIWLVTYRGGDVCMPTHGPGPALGVRNVSFIIEAHTGKMLGEDSTGLAVDCTG